MFTTPRNGLRKVVITNLNKVDIEQTSNFYHSWNVKVIESPRSSCIAKWVRLILLGVVCISAQANSGTVSQNPAADGQHDFDFEIGTWRTELKRLVKPLTGSNQWVECHGTSVVRKVWNGRANLVELTAECPSGHFVGLNLRLYNPESRQWSLNFANASSGTLGTPTIGEFKNGRGEFYDQETYDGRAILVRFVITQINGNVCRFEQSFSEDGGKTWELNWIATDTRIDEPRSSQD